MHVNHTLGSWSAIEDRSWSEYRITAMHGSNILQHTIARVNRNTVNAQANSRLISAAPDLLEAITEIVAVAEAHENSQMQPSLSKAKAAIAKATS